MKNLSIPLLEKLIIRYEDQIDDLVAFIDNLYALNDTIKNITAEKKNTRISFNCSSFAEFLQENLTDLEFKRQVE